MDSFASLALATEAPTLALLERPPYKRDEYIVNRKMVKYILGMGIFEILIIYSICFAGEFFYYEPDVEWRFNNPHGPYVFPGRLYDWDGETKLWILYEKKYGASRHFTNVFNVFVVMQIFNLINNRTITDEINVFKGIFKNATFIIVWIGIAIGQVIIVEVGSIAFKTNHLPGIHWAIAIFCGCLTWIFSIILKFVPDHWCPQFGDKEKNPLEDESNNVLSLRRKRTQSFSLRQPGSVAKEGSGAGRQGSLRG